MNRIMNFFVYGLNHTNKIISDFFKNTVFLNSTYMSTNINRIIHNYNIQYDDIFDLNKAQIKRIIKQMHGEPDWRSNLVKELLDIRDGQVNCILTLSEAKNLLHHISTYR